MDQDLSLPRLPDEPSVQATADPQVFLCRRCRTFVVPQLASAHRCYDYRRIHLPSWKRAVRKR